MFIGSNEALRQRKGSVLYPKQVRKQLPRPFYIILRSEEASKKRTNQGLVLMVMNSDELEGPNVDLRGRKEETYGCKVAAEARRVSLVKPG